MSWVQQLTDLLDEVRRLDEVTFRNSDGDLIIVGRRGDDYFVVRVYPLSYGVGVEVLDPLEGVEEAEA